MFLILMVVIKFEEKSVGIFWEGEDVECKLFFFKINDKKCVFFVFLVIRYVNVFDEWW